MMSSKDIFNVRLLPNFLALSFGVLATLISFSISVIKGIETTSIPDADGYIKQALIFSNGFTSVFENADKLTHGLGYSLTIAGTFLLSNSTSLLLFKILTAATHGVSTYLFTRIVRKYISSAKLVLLCVAFFALDPFVLAAASDVQTEPFTTLFTILWLFLYLSPATAFHMNHGILVIFFVSGFYSVIIRPNSLLPFLLIAILFFFRIKSLELTKKIFILPFSIFAILMTGYEVFLTKLYAGFVFLSPIGGYSSIFMCRKEFVPQYLGIASKSKNDEINAWVMNGGGVKELIESDPTTTISNLDSRFYEIGKEYCLSNPLESVGILILKAAALWRPFTVFGAYSLSVFVISMLIWIPLTITTLRFISRKNLTKNEKLLRLFFLVLSVGYTISLLLTPTQIRHRIAFAEPFYWLFFFHFLALNRERLDSHRIKVIVFFRQFFLPHRN
jgi:hypothetical protein